MTDIVDTTSEEIKKPENKKEIKTNEKGHLVAEDASDLWRIATMAIKSEFLPKGYKKPEQVVIGLQYAIGLGLPPSIASLNEIAVINGNPSLFGDMPLKLVRDSGQLEHIEEYLVTRDYERICIENKNLDAEAWASVCDIKRKGYKQKTFTWTMDQQARTGNRNPVWKAYPTIMLTRKARSIALKSEFSDILGPVSIAEYHHETIPNIREVNEPRQNALDEFESKFGGNNGSGNTDKG